MRWRAATAGSAGVGLARWGNVAAWAAEGGGRRRALALRHKAPRSRERGGSSHGGRGRGHAVGMWWGAGAAGAGEAGDANHVGLAGAHAGAHAGARARHRGHAGLAGAKAGLRRHAWRVHAGRRGRVLAAGLGRFLQELRIRAFGAADGHALVRVWAGRVSAGAEAAPRARGSAHPDTNASGIPAMPSTSYSTESWSATALGTLRGGHGAGGGRCQRRRSRADRARAARAGQRRTSRCRPCGRRSCAQRGRRGTCTSCCTPCT